MEEGSSAAFVLRLSEATTVDVTGQFEAREMTATYGADWTGERTGTFTIKAGDTETSSPTYTALNDSVPFDEAESFIFVLSNVVGATWGDARPALGHIREQSDPEPMMVSSIGSDWLL